jgi:DNA-binding response OmpR family regulator
MISKILLIEDNDLMRKVYSKKLQLANFKVETAVDGKEGLAKAKESKPDLILLDILMPKLNGIEVLKAIRTDHELKGVPVIFMTDFTRVESEYLSSQEEPDGYIIKSAVTPDTIIEEVKKLLVKDEK